MEFNKGDKVLYLPDGQQATITKIINDELVNIRFIVDKVEIPAFIEDIALIAGVTKKEAEIIQQIDNPKNNLSLQKGIYLFFHFEMGKTQLEDSIPILIINNSPDAIHTEINTFHDDMDSILLKNHIQAGEHRMVHMLKLEDVEKHPTFEIDWTINQQLENKFQADIVIRPSTFFKKYGNLSMLNLNGVLYEIKSKNAPKSQQSLKQYTQSTITRQPTIKKSNPSHDVIRKANFDTVLDLHAEKLIGNSKMPSGKILQLQLDTFDRFINEALRLKINQVFVIHGIGNGKLKNEIASRLLMHPQVNTFKNEYHPEFGFGATEVWLY